MSSRAEEASNEKKEKQIKERKTKCKPPKGEV